MNDEKPGVAHLQVGDVVLLGGPLYRSGYEYVQATIMAKSRVWWTVEWYDSIRDAVGSVKVHSVKMTTDDYRYDIFTTQERIAWDERQAAASEYLNSQGVELYRSARWGNDKLTLANLIRRHEGLDEF